MKNIFDWLVEYHSTRNLDRCRPYMKDGRIMFPEGAKPYEDGRGENELTAGFLIVSNGKTLVDRLVDDELVERDDIDHFVDVSSKEKFLSYLDSEVEERSDGAYIYDGVNKMMARVCKIKNSKIASNPELCKHIPNEFQSYSGNVSLRKIGTKTMLAIGLAVKYPHIETFQIKRTPYTNLGMGIVTHFAEGKFDKMYYIKNVAGKLIGSIREYGLEDNRLVMKTEHSTNIQDAPTGMFYGVLTKMYNVVFCR